MAKVPTLRDHVNYAREHIAWDTFCLNRQGLASATIDELVKLVKNWLPDTEPHWLEEWTLFLEGWEAARERYEPRDF